MTPQEAIAIVHARYPNASAFKDVTGHWSISVNKAAPVRIPGVGWHNRVEIAWMEAAETIRDRKGTP